MIATTAISIASTLSRAASYLHDKHRAEVRELVLDELRAGNITELAAHMEDDFIACMHRIERARLEGRAHYKLRLMARVLRGQIEYGTLDADEFATHADIIESLTDKEVTYAASIHQAEILDPSIKTYPNRGQVLALKLRSQLVPLVFASNDEMNASATALLRTGLILQAAMSTDGAAAFVPSPLLDRFVVLAGLEPSL
jgi:hypothetical protein